MTLLDKLAERDSDWIRMAQSFGLTIDSARELVQDMYVKLYDKTTLDKIKYGDDDVNTFYVYVTLRNLYYDRQRVKITYVDLDEAINDEPDLIESKHLLEELLNAISDTIEDLHWYDKKIFEIYYGDNKTIRALSEDSKISQSSIFNTLKNVRTKIKENHKEAYEEYRQAKGEKE
jgi:RNA polymerase sigma factor (sigma-70 family)